MSAPPSRYHVWMRQTLTYVTEVRASTRDEAIFVAGRLLDSGLSDFELIDREIAEWAADPTE